MQERNSRKKVRRRPVSHEALINSILYIRARDRYLQENGILLKTGPRAWRLNIKKTG
jgi:hypothetical protein